MIARTILESNYKLIKAADIALDGARLLPIKKQSAAFMSAYHKYLSALKVIEEAMHLLPQAAKPWILYRDAFFRAEVADHRHRIRGGGNLQCRQLGVFWRSESRQARP